LPTPQQQTKPRSTWKPSKSP